MILFEHVEKKYPGNQLALASASFHLHRGEMAFVTGHSGAGKSTLLKLIMLMERPTNGRIVIAGKALKDIKPRQVPYYRRHVGVVFQNHRLLFDRSVYENVALPLRICGTPERDIGRQVRSALDKVGLLKREQFNPMQLSGGEQQRIGIARAIVNRPPLLLADEPTGNLDPKLSSDIMHLFEQLNQVGVTVLIATHDLALIEGLPHRILTLQDGTVFEQRGAHVTTG